MKLGKFVQPEFNMLEMAISSLLFSKILWFLTRS